MAENTEKVIFVYPYRLNPDASNASHLRPYNMYQAFKRVLGDKLLVSSGTKRFTDIPAHERFKGLYLESINRPFFIQRILEKDWKIFSDYWNLWKLKRRGVKLSVFYRDGFWAGGFLAERYSRPLALLLKGCYQLEWFFFKKLFDNIYLPSLELAEYMGETKTERFKVLFPGCLPPSLSTPSINSADNKQLKLTLLYSGGITPPLNDITLMLKLLGDREHVQLIILTRRHEWDKYQGYYNFDYSNVEVILNQSAAQLGQYYRRADASVMLYPFHPYRYLAMPYKAFEAISYGLPLVSFADCIMGKFINNHSLGLALSYNELERKFSDIAELSNELKNYRKQVLEYAHDNLWNDRVKQVLNDFSSEFQ